MPIANWREYPRFARAAGEFRIQWTDQKWQILQEYLTPVDERLIPLFLAILVQEGTGSFNTSAVNLAGDGGHGPNDNFPEDLQLAANLVLGKLMLYPQAVEQGFCERAARIVSLVEDRPWSDFGTPIQWVNWPTAVVRPNGQVECLAMYAQDAASWWVNVQWLYEREFGCTREGLADVCRKLEMGAPLRGHNVGAPLLAFRFGWVKNDVGLACTYGENYELVPRPAVLVTAAEPAAERVRVKQADDASDPEAPELVPAHSYAAEHPEIREAAATAETARTVPLYLNGTVAGTCEVRESDLYLTTALASLLAGLGYRRGEHWEWHDSPRKLTITVEGAAPQPTELPPGGIPVYVNGTCVGAGRLNPENRFVLDTPVLPFLDSLGYRRGEGWSLRQGTPGLFVTSSPKR